MFVYLIWLCCGLIGIVCAHSSTSLEDNLPAEYCRLPQPPPATKYFSVFCYDEDPPWEECLNVPGTPVRHNWTITYICDQGYYFPRNNGYVDSRCLRGQWVPPPPPCKDRVCTVPSDPASGRYMTHPLDCAGNCGTPNTQLRDNALLRLQCVAGHAPSPAIDDTALCVGGEWILPAGCVRITTWTSQNQIGTTNLSEKESCALPEPPRHGTYFSSACYRGEPQLPECLQTPGALARHSWTLTFLCDNNYLPDNNQTYYHSKCVHGRWLPPPPNCTVSLEGGCTVPSQPPHGRYTLSGCGLEECPYVPGRQVPRSHKLTLTCSEGCLPGQGYALSTCQDGHWSPPPPKCQNSSEVLFEQRDISELQSKFAGCVLPQPPTNGRYALFSDGCQKALPNQSHCQKLPGERVPHLQVLSFSCDYGYRLGVQNGAMTFLLSCDDGQWSQTLPECYKPCPALKSLTVDVECFQGPKQVPCDVPMLPGSTATTKCKLNHATIDDPRDLICKPNGLWSGRLPDCRPNCGLSKLNNFVIMPTILDGEASPLGYFPWHAGIYHRSSNGWDAKCGGTLISPHIILTAAHCVTVQSKRMKCEDVRVALGKYYRDWDTEEHETVKREVKDIQIQPNYLGADSFLDLDIALLALDSPVVVNSFVMPACVDYYRTHPLRPSMIGYLAGWGKTEECEGKSCGDPSDTLIYTNTSFLQFRECYDSMQRLKRLGIARITSDKFCAGNGSKSVAQKGDSGGGITFEFEGVHYVKGVISAKIFYPGSYSFSAFTNVTHHINWIQKIASYLDSII